MAEQIVYISSKEEPRLQNRAITALPQDFNKQDSEMLAKILIDRVDRHLLNKHDIKLKEFRIEIEYTIPL